MKLLIDNQLPPALARFLTSELGEEAVHVRDVQLDRATDLELWNHASNNGYIVISNDEDFFFLVTMRPTARLLWVRLRNCHRNHLLEVFGKMWPQIASRFRSGEMFVELR